MYIYVTEQKQTHTNREQTGGHHWGEKSRGWGQVGEGASEAQATMCKISKLRAYTVQHREYSRQFVITLNEV